jgi:hypothetical protein
MDFSDPITTSAVVAAVLMLTVVGLRLRQQRAAPRRRASADALDTVTAWPPASVRVMTIAERQGYELLKRALPGFTVLAQVPLARFIRVPTQHSYSDWMGRVGSLSADLLLCDSGSRVLAVIDVRSPQESERSRKRHERMARVLKAAGVRVHTWREDDLPSLAEVRTVLGNEIGQLAPGSADGAPKATTSRPMPLIPVAEIAEILAEGANAHRDVMEPVPSAFFDDMELAPTGARR